MLDPTDSALRRARELVRSNLSATLLFDQTPLETKWMIDPRTGHGIVAISPEALDATDTVLACPRDAMDTPVRIAVSLSDEIDEEQSDRFTAYHTPPTKPTLGLARINFVKIDSGEVFEPDALALHNPLVSSMGPLCKALNADKTKLSALCKSRCGTAIQDPVAVGVDDQGIDIRAHHRLIRLTHPDPITNADQALGVVSAMLGAIDA